MNFKKFNELTDSELEKIINKHYNHWVQYSPTMDFEITKNKFKNVYAKNNTIPFGIAMIENNDIIGFLVFKKENLKKYPQYSPWIDDVMIYDNYRNHGYGRKMINEAFIILKKMGYNKIYLWTDKAPLFYEKLGFKYEREVEKNEGGFGKLYSKDI